MKIFENIWKYTVCSWLHYKEKCYPEVWGRGLDGPWHCTRCHPCGEEIEELFKRRIKVE